MANITINLPGGSLSSTRVGTLIPPTTIYIGGNNVYTWPGDIISPNILNLQSWVERPSSIKGIFVKVNTLYSANSWVSSSINTFYLSNTSYTTQDGVVTYDAVLTQGIQFTESISIEGTTSLSYGSLQIKNLNGEYDTWLDSNKYIWNNQSIQIFLGDPFTLTPSQVQLENDFLMIFNGVVSSIDSKSRELLSINLVDKLQRLNTPLTEDKLGVYGTWSGGQTNKDIIKPIVFGEVFNISPTLIDPPNREYYINNGTMERVIEVRDSGVPISYTANNSTGKITLTSGATVAQITASVQGVKQSLDLGNRGVVSISSLFDNNIANLIGVISTQYGNTNNRLLATDLDYTNLSIFKALNPQKIGYYVSDRTNILNICQDIAGSIGAQLYMTRTGKLQILQLGVPTLDTPVTITDNDIILHSLSISNRPPVKAASTLAYCKNWTVQSNLVTDIPAAHKDSYALEFFTTTQSDATIQSRYKLDLAPVEKQTMLITTEDAIAEAIRLRDYFKIPKTVYKFTGIAKLLTLKLGQQVTLVHNRFNLYNSGNGQVGQVISLSPDWIRSTIDIEVII
jgi:hypothetical protein